jgi:UDP-N-acetylmuramoylalanine--D-glutamate ligase
VKNRSLYGIWGAGREGISVGNMLHREGHLVVVVDETLAKRPEELDDGVEFFTGSTSLEKLSVCSTVVASPGVPRTHPFREKLNAANVDTTTATNLWLSAHTGDVIGVTGTKGKSTTSSLLNFLLNSGDVDSQLGGNIGIPLTDLPHTDAVTVVEMSSYQCAFLKKSPRIAVVTNLFQDHLPWHGSLQQYWRDKSAIFRLGAEVLVCSEVTHHKLRELGVEFPQQVVYPSSELVRLLSVAELPPIFAARHNQENLALAVTAAQHIPDFTMSVSEIIASLAQFTGLPHRLAIVSTLEQRLWVDDTLSTTTESVIAAIESFSGREMALIVGGLDRGVDYAPLNTLLLTRKPAIQVVCLPENGVTMVSPYRELNPGYVHEAKDMDDAIRIAADHSAPGSVVLLSPGAPSHNRYRNYEEKSEDFVRAIAEVVPLRHPRQ